jgi:AAA ATPase domain
MNDEPLFPPYIPRDDEERQIRDELRRVREDGLSRVVLLYGAGGIGKTRLVRHLATASQPDSDVAWLDPVDVDDARYWLLSNLERRVIRQLDPDLRYFEPYLDYVRRLPGQTLARIDGDTVVSRLDAIKQVFASCYARFAQEAGKTMVIVFDTVEVIRGVPLLYTLTDWMKSLPATLFILSGRPMPSNQTGQDPVERELQEGQKKLPVTRIRLGEFGWYAALDFLRKSKATTGLSEDEIAKLALLTRGHPLWLAFTITYLVEVDVPEEAEHDLAELEREMPYDGKLSNKGSRWYQSYKRRLGTPYQQSDFEHETIRRLAVVRQSVNQPIWERLMADRAQRDGIASWSEEWEKLRQTPWIRTRSNNRYLTLHDAVAEELSLHIIPTQDPDGSWRRDLWNRAAAIYAELSDAPAKELEHEREQLDLRLQHLDRRQRDVLEGRSRAGRTDADSASVIEEIADLDRRKRELDELGAISMHFELLANPEKGAERFRELFEQARRRRDALGQDRLALEMQQFLPSPLPPPIEDVVGQVVKSFREWLKEDGKSLYERIALDLAEYQIEIEQPQAANEILGSLPEQTSDPERRFRLNIAKGNALMRIPGQSEHAEPYFQTALELALSETSPDASLRQAQAYKELGFYNRQRGRWHLADDNYQQARDVISARLLISVTDEDRKEMASVQRNWAYVKGISGQYTTALHLIESAIKIYRFYGMRLDEAASLSVLGESHRYAYRFEHAWQSFAAAEQIFDSLRNRAWLGVIKQEQAICLAQAERDGVVLVLGKDMKEEAKRLIRQALDICQELNLRAYPSALNRAARILGPDDIEVGLRYAEEGIAWGERLSDAWKSTACLVEYVELCYQAWDRTHDERYRDGIRSYAERVEEATAKADFVDLRGKWNLMQGHLKIADWMSGADVSLLRNAVENYEIGFVLIAQTFAGSSSGFTLNREFERFRKLLLALPSEVRAEWLVEFRRYWSTQAQGDASTCLLARLEELY